MNLAAGAVATLSPVPGPGGTLPVSFAGHSRNIRERARMYADLARRSSHTNLWLRIRIHNLEIPLKHHDPPRGEPNRFWGSSVGAVPSVEDQLRPCPQFGARRRLARRRYPSRPPRACRTSPAVAYPSVRSSIHRSSGKAAKQIQTGRPRALKR